MQIMWKRSGLISRLSYLDTRYFLPDSYANSRRLPGPIQDLNLPKGGRPKHRGSSDFGPIAIYNESGSRTPS